MELIITLNDKKPESEKLSQAPVLFLENYFSKQLSTTSFFNFGVTRLTIGTTISPAIMEAAPALIGELKKLRNIFDTVIPTPTRKLVHTAALVTPFQ